MQIETIRTDEFLDDLLDRIGLDYVQSNVEDLPDDLSEEIRKQVGEESADNFEYALSYGEQINVYRGKNNRLYIELSDYINEPKLVVIA